MATGFESGRRYEWRVAYQDAGSGEYSPWSEWDNFLVGASQVDENIPPMEPGLQMKDYKMISFIEWPEDPSAKAVFGPFVGEDYEKNFRIGTYDPTLGSGGYLEYAGFTVEPGRAYWFLARLGEDLHTAGVPVSTDVDFCTPLKYNSTVSNGWNMIAPPNNANYRWGDLQVVEKDAAGNIVYGPVYIFQLQDDNPYIDTRIWEWRKGAYNPTRSGDFLLQRYSGYWVCAKKANVYLCFPAESQIAQITPMMMIAAWVRDVKDRAGEIILGIEAAYADFSTDNPPMPMSGFDKSPSGGGGSGCFVSTIIDDDY